MSPIQCMRTLQRGGLGGTEPEWYWLQDGRPPVEERDTQQVFPIILELQDAPGPVSIPNLDELPVYTETEEELARGDAEGTWTKISKPMFDALNQGPQKPNLFPYMGSKRTIFPFLKKVLDHAARNNEDIVHLIEPFVGAATLVMSGVQELSGRQLTSHQMSDLNSQLINLYKVLLNYAPKDLVSSYAAMMAENPLQKAQDLRDFAATLHQHVETLDADQAMKYLYASRFSVGGVMEKEEKWTGQFRKRQEKTTQLQKKIEEFRNQCTRVGATFSKAPWEAVMTQDLGRNTMVYCDSPYVQPGGKADKTYGEFTLDNFYHLACRAKDLALRGVTVLLSNYAWPEVLGILKDTGVTMQYEFPVMHMGHPIEEVLAVYAPPDSPFAKSSLARHKALFTFELPTG